MSVCKPTVCLHFELIHFLKYDALSEFSSTFMFATLLIDEVIMMFRGFAIEKSGTHAGVNRAACMHIHLETELFQSNFSSSRESFVVDYFNSILKGGYSGFRASVLLITMVRLLDTSLLKFRKQSVYNMDCTPPL